MASEFLAFSVHLVTCPLALVSWVLIVFFTIIYTVLALNAHAVPLWVGGAGPRRNENAPYIYIYIYICIWTNGVRRKSLNIECVELVVI